MRLWIDCATGQYLYTFIFNFREVIDDERTPKVRYLDVRLAKYTNII